MHTDLSLVRIGILLREALQQRRRHHASAAHGGPPSSSRAEVRRIHAAAQRESVKQPLLLPWHPMLVVGTTLLFPDLLVHLGDHAKFGKYIV